MAEVLRARLGPLSLPALLQLLDAEAFDGWLVLEPAGRLALREGLIVAAEVGGFSGMDAFKLLCLIEEGAATALDDAPPEGRPLGPTTHLVFVALRFVDEWRRLAPRRLRPEPGLVGDSPEVAEVLAALDGHLTLAEAVALTGHAPPTVLDALGKAFSEGLLEEVGAPSSEHVSLFSTGPDDPEALLDTGRAHLKRGELARAELCFQRALHLDPDHRVARQNLNRTRQLRRAGGI